MQALPLAPFPILLITKYFVIFALSLYLIFAIVVIRQVQLMTDTLEVGFEIPLKIISYLHFLLAIGVLAFAVLTL